MVLASNHTWYDKFRNGFKGLFDLLPNLPRFLAVLVAKPRPGSTAVR